MPLITKLIELAAPVSSFIVLALAVPIACEALPKATSLAMSDLIFISLKTQSLTIAPNIPVNMMVKTVIYTIPPIDLETSMPIAVVMDLGSSVAKCTFSSINIL